MKRKAKRVTIIVVAIMAIIFGNGCASPGRFSLLDLDLRTPEQIEAYKAEAQVPYEIKETPDKVAVAPKSASIWSFLAPIIQVFKGRIKILSFEWKGNQQQK